MCFGWCFVFSEFCSCMDLSSEKKIFVFLLIFLSIGAASAQQVINKYQDFELKEGELYWRSIYSYPEKTDSLRGSLEQLLVSKSFTQNVTQTETGYTGEIKAYRVNCKRYGRKYMNTLRMYWEGNWTGKFIVEIKGGRYRVTVYGLYYEITESKPAYNRVPSGPLKGKYIDAVCGEDYLSFRKSELNHMSLMNLALKDDDIKNLKLIKGRLVAMSSFGFENIVSASLLCPRHSTTHLLNHD